jgi:prevent-host-death family protein
MRKTISSSELKRHLGAWLDGVGRDRGEVIIETYGRPVAVLLAYEDYAAFQAYRESLSPPAATADGRSPRETMASRGWRAFGGAR